MEMETFIWKLKPSIDLRDKKRNSACAAYIIVLTWHNIVLTWHNIVLTWHNIVVTWHNIVVTWHNIEAHWRITVAVEKKKKFYILVCVCVCVRARARSVGWLRGWTGAWACACPRVLVPIYHATHTRRVVTSIVARMAPHNIFRHFLTSGTIIEKKVLNIKCVFGFSLQLLSKTILIVRNM
jgi:hypothetical protein